MPPEDPQALQEALLRLLCDWDLAERCRARVDAVRESFRWSRALEPLAAFCRSPRWAADRAQKSEAATAPDSAEGAPEAVSATPRNLSELVRFHYKQGGVAEVGRRAASKALRVARRY